MIKFEIGQRAGLTFEVKRVDTDTFVDPTQLAVDVERPDGTAVTQQLWPGAVIRLGLGLFKAIVDIDQSGTWHFGGVATGAAQGATGDKTFHVLKSRF